MITKKMIKNIVIVNAHWNNRGDEAAILAVLEGIKNKCASNVKTTILFKDDKSIEQFPNLDGVDYGITKFNAKVWDIWLSTLSYGVLGINKKLKELVRKIKKSDFIIYSPGGSVINKRFYWRKQMEYLVPFICARLYKIPMFVAAPSLGPFDLSQSNYILKWLLKTPKILCVREEISKEYLKQIGIENNVEVTIDSAFYNEINLNDNYAKLGNYNELKNFLTKYEKVIGITISDFSWHVKLNKELYLVERIENTFKKLIEKLSIENYGILFIPQLFGNQNDYTYMQTFSTENTFVMSDKYDSYFQQYIISQIYAVIGTRYHSNIFAAKMGTPFLSIVYEEKMEGFLKKAGLKGYSIQISELSFELIEEKFQSLIKNYTSIKNLLNEQHSEWQRTAEWTMDLLAKACQKKSDGHGI